MTKQEQLDKINNRSEFNKYNGITVTDVDSGRCTVEVELCQNSMNPWGSAHGGLVFALCDVAAGVAASDGETGCVTQSGNLYYLRPAVGRKLICVGTVIKNGKNVALVETNVHNDEGVHVARGEFEYFHTGMPLPDA